MAIWIKQNGVEISLNDEPATELKARELGWELTEEEETEEE